MRSTDNMSGGENPIDTGAADLEGSGNLGSTKALITKLPDSGRIDSRGPAFIDPPT